MVSGKPSAEWTTKYGQWIYSLPKGKNPLENGNVSVQNSRDESFICLPCTGGGEACGRTLNILQETAEKSILIPIFAAACSTAEVGENLSDSTLLEMVRDDVVQPVHLQASLNGMPLRPHYVESSLFEVDIPTNPIFEVKVNRGRYRAASAGFWYRLDPLPLGIHEIRFGGTGRNGFHTSVVYSVRAGH